MTGILITLINLLSTALIIAIFARILLSWVSVNPGAAWVRIIYQITEPILAPIRRLLPTMGGFDFSPVIVFVLIEIARNLLIRILV